MVTAAFSRSFTAENDIIAAPELIPDVHGVQILRIMMQTNCMVTAADE